MTIGTWVLGAQRPFQSGGRFSAKAVETLARGRALNAWSERNLYFGGVHAVAPGGEGAGDPRRQGHACRVD